MIVERLVKILCAYYRDFALYILCSIIALVFLQRYTRVFSKSRKKTNSTYPESAVSSVFEDEASPLLLGETDEYGLEEEEEVGLVPYSTPRYSEQEAIERSAKFYRLLNSRRTCRMFSSDDVPRKVIENIIHSAGTAPSGAHTEPWTFVAVRNQQVKAQLRKIVEEEEYLNYTRRMGKKWVKDLEKLRTNWEKEYIEHAPWVVVVFRQVHGYTASEAKKTHYYSEVSVSLSIGLLLAALTNAGLASVTHTPLNVGSQLRSLFSRPSNEKFVMLLPIGYAATNATVPDLHRKPLEQIMSVFD